MRNGRPCRSSARVRGQAAADPRSLKGRQGTAREFLRDPHAKTSRVNVVPVPDRPLLLDFNGGADAYVARAEVTEGVLPSVAEIIARHQEAQAAQDALLETVRGRRAHGAALPAQPSPTPATTSSPRTASSSIATATSGRSCASPSTDRSGERDRPAFPLLQPEKVLSLPLDLRLTKDYRYRLEGRRHGRRPRRLRRALRARGRRALALSRHDLDRRRDVRAAQGAGGADAAGRAGRLQRGDPVLHARRPRSTASRCAARRG